MEIEEYWWLYFNYLYFCQRQLWLYNKWIMTNEDDINIIIWKINQENFNKNELRVWNISIDKIKKGVIYEYKKSNKHILWSIAQLENYIYLLNNKYNIKIHKWILKFKDWRDIEIKYDNILKQHYIENINKIKEIIKYKNIPLIENDLKLCKKCWYYEKCYI